MPVDISHLGSTIIPKSDQLNAEQLLAGSMTITITDVRAGSDEQPIAIHYAGDEGRPYKPGKTMRKVLVFAWGEDGRQWIGRSLTLYCDSSVKFGGIEVGGIRISHMSHIQKTINVALTSTRGKKAMHSIQILKSVGLDEVLGAIGSAKNKADMDRAKELAMQLVDEQEVLCAQTAYKEKVEALKKLSAKQPE